MSFTHLSNSWLVKVVYFYRSDSRNYTCSKKKWVLFRKRWDFSELIFVVWWWRRSFFFICGWICKVKFEISYSELNFYPQSRKWHILKRRGMFSEYFPWFRLFRWELLPVSIFAIYFWLLLVYKGSVESQSELLVELLDGVLAVSNVLELRSTSVTILIGISIITFSWHIPGKAVNYA